MDVINGLANNSTTQLWKFVLECRNFKSIGWPSNETLLTVRASENFVPSAAIIYWSKDQNIQKQQILHQYYVSTSALCKVQWIKIHSNQFIEIIIWEECSKRKHQLSFDFKAKKNLIYNKKYYQLQKTQMDLN